MVKEDADLEQYTRSLVWQESLRLQLRLRTSSVGIMIDKKRWRMSVEDRCAVQ